VNTNFGRAGASLERLAPFLIVVAIAVVGYFWFIQAPLANYLRARVDTATLAERVRTLENAKARSGRIPAGDLDAPVREFEKRVSRDDKVADVTGQFAKTVLECAPPDKLREFAIETGARVSSEGNAAGVRAAALLSSSLSPDPRFSLFPIPVSYTPVKVTFASTFEAVAAFMWRMRDLPTTIEIRSATLTRGLPLMKLEVTVWVYQRGDAATPAPGPAQPLAQPPVSPTAPRVAMMMDGGR
jgi:hypothetical protein